MNARKIIAGLVLAACAAAASAGTYVSVSVPGLAIAHTSGNTTMVAGMHPAYAPNYYGGERHHHHGGYYAPRPWAAQQVVVMPAPAPVYYAPAPVVTQVIYADPRTRRQQDIQDMVNTCQDPRTSRTCAYIDGQNVCVTCNN